jgi:hypothetical protein
VCTACAWCAHVACCVLRLLERTRVCRLRGEAGAARVRERGTALRRPASLDQPAPRDAEQDRRPHSAATRFHHGCFNYTGREDGHRVPQARASRSVPGHSGVATHPLLLVGRHLGYPIPVQRCTAPAWPVGRTLPAVETVAALCLAAVLLGAETVLQRINRCAVICDVCFRK